jgi:nucleoside-diphosphate-sugar epimerase
VIYPNGIKSVRSTGSFLQTTESEVSITAPLGTVVVTGGAGYLGSVLVRKLLERGYRTVVFDRLLYGDDGIRELNGRDGFEFVRGDVRSFDELVSVLRSADAVVHLAAIVGDPACALDQSLALEVNLAATATVVRAAHVSGVRRLIFASSCAVYGCGEQFPDEDSTLKPLSLYARTKVAAEEIVLKAANERVASTALRLATLYGLSPRPRFDLLINLFAAQAMEQGEITILGGRQWRPFLHVTDAADAVAACLEAPESAVKGEAFNVGGDDQNYRIEEVAQLVKKIVPGLTIRNAEAKYGPNYRVSFAKIRNRLPFVPQHEIEGGVSEIIKASRRGEIGGYRQSRNSNVQMLKERGFPAIASSPPAPPR